MKRFSVFLLLMMAPAAVRAETASAWVDSHNARVRLIAGRVVAAEGDKLAAGVEIEMTSGWKTYWRNPGDSGGVPPSFNWSASGNLGAAAVLFPAPYRLKDVAGDAIGYKDRVVFPILLTPADPAQPVDLNVALEFGICREICVPATANLELSVPPSTGKAPAALQASLDNVPRPAAARREADPEFKPLAAVLSGDKPTLTFEASFPGGMRGADAYIEAPDGIYVPQPILAGPNQGHVRRYEVTLDSGVDPQDVKGKTLTVTLASEAGSSEHRWKID